MRREQVHKLVLNQLLTADLELQPMQMSDRAWLWGGYNYSEDGCLLEKLAIRFKNTDLAQQFHHAVTSVQEILATKQSEQGDYSRDDDEYVSDESDENR